MSRDLQPIYAKSFINRLHLVLHACIETFDVTFFCVYGVYGVGTNQGQTHRKKKENRMTSWYIHSAGECYPHLFAINHGNSTSNNIPRIYMQRDANTTVSEITENLL